MAWTPQQIQAAIATSDTDLYTAFVNGAATRGVLVSLDLTNTTGSDITVDVFWKNAAGSVTRRFSDDKAVPGKSSITWRGMIACVASGEKIVAIASAAGVDALGTVVENV